jgi:hypothetical protein
MSIPCPLLLRFDQYLCCLLLFGSVPAALPVRCGYLYLWLVQLSVVLCCTRVMLALWIPGALLADPAISLFVYVACLRKLCSLKHI